MLTYLFTIRLMEYINFILLIVIIYLLLKPNKNEEIIEEPKGEFYIPPKETIEQKMVKRGIRNAIENGRKDR